MNDLNLLIFGSKLKICSRNESDNKIEINGSIDLMTNHVLLIFGLALNFLIIIVIVLNHSMHKSTSCYILSFVSSNLLLLLDTLSNNLHWWYNINIYFDIPYIISLTFNSSILTLGMLTMDRYIFIHKRLNSAKNSRLMNNSIFHLKIAGKIVIVIWIFTLVITAMEFHLYEKFERKEVYTNNIDPRIQIFVIFSFIFVALPMILIIWLGSLLIYEMEQLRMIAGVNKEDAESLRLLAGITVGFLFTMAPYRVALIFNYLFPIMCCSKDNLRLCCTIIKGTIIVFPLICFATSRQIQSALKKTLFRCRCNLTKPENLKNASKSAVKTVCEELKTNERDSSGNYR
ncbi:uncharacterized protein LOC122497566 [Leptopilina heterotoma]|uniref:uncharacterized protein LOC122497566 n=1 Tax=Leptopilina heterotoma TaxID=63436 RepID=UPI001CA9A6FF|nr:uncharacterized protein LOC122497566 [Leptopilina heterotoma]